MGSRLLPLQFQSSGQEGHKGGHGPVDLGDIVHEVGCQDLWQRAEIGVTTVGNDRAVINQRLDHVINFVEDLGAADLVDHRIELINM